MGSIAISLSGVDSNSRAVDWDSLHTVNMRNELILNQLITK